MEENMSHVCSAHEIINAGKASKIFLHAVLQSLQNPLFPTRYSTFSEWRDEKGFISETFLERIIFIPKWESKYSKRVRMEKGSLTCQSDMLLAKPHSVFSFY